MERIEISTPLNANKNKFPEDKEKKNQIPRRGSKPEIMSLSPSNNEHNNKNNNNNRNANNHSSEHTLINYLTNELSLSKSKINFLEKENKNLRSRLLMLEKFLKPEIDRQVILKQLILSDIIYNISEFDVFNRRLLRHNKRSIYNLLFKATVDGDKADAFHNSCDQYNSTLVLIRTDKGRRFGGFAYEKWEGEDISKVDNRAFIFSLDKKKVFNIKRNEEAIGCYKVNGPDFCGWQIVVQDNFLSNKQCYTGEKDMNFETEEDYEINGGEKYFGISELEVFQLKYE